MSLEFFAGGSLTAEALASAARAHEGQTRKSPKVPYIIHPVRVMLTLVRHGITDDDILSAALLHDTVEDTDVTLDNIKESFNDRVAEFVADVTEQKFDRPGGPKRPWKVRKQHCIRMVRNEMTWPGVAIKIADQIDNLSSMLHPMEQGVEEDDFWEEFGGDKASQYWYSKGIYQAAQVRLSLEDICETGLRSKIREMLTEMSSLVFAVFGELARDLTDVPSEDFLDAAKDRGLLDDD